MSGHSTAGASLPAAVPAPRGAGVCLVTMLVISVAATFWSALSSLMAPVLAWVALAMLWTRVGRQQRWQTVAFVAAGAAMVLWALGQGVPLEPERILGQNQPILSMLAGITLLRLLNTPLSDDEPELPRGFGTYLQSLFGVHLFGAVINISAVILMADRLSREAPLRLNQAELLSRSFTAVAFYSPFIGGVALALAYTPGSNPLLLLAFGGPVAMAALILLVWYGRSGRVDDIENFRGYPVHFESLWLPLVLGTAVLTAYATTTGYTVLTLITVLAPLVGGGALLLRGGVRGTREALGEYVSVRLPQMGGELALFLGAGVLGAGLVSVFASTGGWVPFDRIDAWNGSLVLVGCILTSLACIHPIVLLSVLVPLLPTIEHDPSFVAVMFAMAWGLGCAVNPMSGINLVLSSRYGASNWTLGRANLPFTLTLLPVAAALLYVDEGLFGLPG